MTTMFTPDGREVRVTGNLEDGKFVGHVQVQVEDFNDGGWFDVDGPLEVFETLFEKKPKRREDPDRVAHQSELQRLAKDIENKQQDLNDINRQIAEFQKNPFFNDFSLLYDVAAGTTIWIVDENLTIREYPKDFGDSDDRSRKMSPAISWRSVVNKYGNREMKLVLHQYYDTSGSDKEDCKFFRTEEEAVTYLRPQLIEKAKAANGEAGYWWNLEDLVKKFQKVGLENTPELNAALEVSRQRSITLAKEKLATAQAELLKLEGTA